MRYNLHLPAALLLGLTFSACDSDSSGGETTPPDPVTTTAAVNNSVSLALNEAAEAFEFLNDSEMADELFGLIDGDEGASDCAIGGMPVNEFGEPMDDFEDPCEDMEDEDGEGFSVDFQEGAKDAAEWVAEEVFTEENVEETSGSAIIYRVPVDLVCQSGSEPTYAPSGDDFGEPAEAGAPAMSCPPCDPEWTEEECASFQEACLEEMNRWEEPEDEEPDMMPPDPMDDEEGKSCEELFTEVPLRLRVKTSGNGHTVDLLVGDKKSNPASAFLAPDELAIEVDAEGAQEAIETITEAMEEEAPEFPGTLEGRVKLGLKKNAADNYTVALSIVKALKLAMNMDDETFSVEVASTEPTLAITADGNAKALSVDGDLGAVDVSVPGSLFSGESCYWDDEMGYDVCEEEDGPEGQFAAHLGGASASITLSTSSDEDALTITNIGLGDSTTTIRYDGAQIIGLDLNPSHGRHFDLEMTSVEDLFTLSVDPALVLEIALDMAKAGELAEDAPAFMMDEDLTASLTGSSPTISFSDEQMRVESGTLTLSATSVADVVVEAGMCMEIEGDSSEIPLRSDGDSMEEPFMPEEEEDGDDDEHPFSGVKAVACE